MKSREELRKIAVCCHLLEPPAAKVISELLEEIHRLHSKLELIERTASQHEIKQLAREDIYHGA